ncbi:MAG: carboxypeptidase-like regulatory domain-containing protein [Myxococcota bacterium]
MQDKWIRKGLILCTLAALGACGTEGDDLGPADDAQANVVEDEGAEGITVLTGQLLDTDERPVAHAEAVLVIGSVPVSEPVVTDLDGRYTLAIPTGRVWEAWASGFEVTVVFETLADDRLPHGTAEGDLIHVLPATLEEFVTPSDVVSDARLEMKTAYVPRQGQGFPITDELIQNGGELTWVTNDSQYGEDFRVSLLIEPGSIHLGQEAQDEITLTLIEQVKAPMSIPEDGFGPMWTIQPRDVVFDPPARIRIEGNRFPVLGASELAVGERTELFGASLETGWKLFGEIELADETDGRITLETPEGIISHGAWGHIFSNTDNDYGMLVECFNADGSARVPCAVLNDNTYWYQDPNNFNAWNITNLCEEPGFTPPPGVGGGYDDGFLTCDQWDFGTGNHDGNHMVYSSDAETRCRGCGGASAPYVLAMSAGESLGGSTDPVWGAVTAFPLCPEEADMTDMDALWSSLYQRLGNWNHGGVLPFENAAVSGEIEASLNWRNFSKSVQIFLPEPTGCAG